MDKQVAFAEVIASGKELLKKGLVARTWGNISCRINEKQFAITPSGRDYESLTLNDIVVVNIDDLEYEGDVKPSSEKGIHAAAYKNCPNVNFVIHTHQMNATLLSTASNIKSDKFKNIFYNKEFSCASYGLPGTKKLCANVTTQIQKGFTSILMERHGAVVLGDSRTDAFQKINDLEEACQKILSSYISVTNNTEITDCNDKALVSIIQKETDNEYVKVLSSDVINSVSSCKVVPSMIDDFAQISGIDIKVVSDTKKIIPALKNRNCVIVKGLGALCCASTLEDVLSVASLAQKNCLSFLFMNKLIGKAKALPFLDRVLMRFVYKMKYSKLKAVK